MKAIPEPSAKITIDMTDDVESPDPPGYYVIAEALSVEVPETKPHSRELTAA